MCAAQTFDKGGSLRRGAVGSLLLHELILAIDALFKRFGLDLRLVWVPRERNQLADDDSKIVDPFNFALSRPEFERLDRLWGPHQVDRFADDANALLASFNSRWWCLGTAAVDASSVPWGNGVVNWLHPPAERAIISMTLAKLRTDRGRGTLIVPAWSNNTWWPTLYPIDRRSPVVARRLIPTAQWSFVAFEPRTHAGVNGTPPAWPMIALRLDFSR
jgi:hypothetical protein